MPPIRRTPAAVLAHRGLARLAAVLAVSGFGALAGSCDFLENPDEVQNTSNNAFVEAQIFRSRDNRVPVEGVIMYVESDPDSESPFEGPDQTFVSDRNGFVRAAVFPGLDPEAEEPEGGPTTPFEVRPPLAVGDACVHFLFDGHFSTFSCGVSLGPGKVINLGIFFADEFTSPPDVGGE
jgi:hypothetical protein